MCYTPGFHIGLTVPPIFHFPPKSYFVLPITCKWFRFLYSPKHTSCLHHSKEMWDTLIREPESNIRINRSEMGTSNHTETNLKKMITPSSSLLRWGSLINSSQSYCLINFPNKWIKNIYIYIFDPAGRWRQLTTTNPRSSADTFFLVILFPKRSCPISTALCALFVPGIVPLTSHISRAYKDRVTLDRNFLDFGDQVGLWHYLVEVVIHDVVSVDLLHFLRTKLESGFRQRCWGFSV